MTVQKCLVLSSTFKGEGREVLPVHLWVHFYAQKTYSWGPRTGVMIMIIVVKRYFGLAKCLPVLFRWSVSPQGL